MHARAHTYTYSFARKPTYIYKFTPAYLRIFTHASTYIYTRTCTDTHTHTHTHTHTYAHICDIYEIAVTIYVMAGSFTLMPLMPIFLDIVHPLNETRPRIFIISIDWKIDQEKYFVPIYCYLTSIAIAGIIIVIGIDAMHVNYTAHACSLFSIIG